MNAIAANRRHPAAAYVVLLLALVSVGALYAAPTPMRDGPTPLPCALSPWQLEQPSAKSDLPWSTWVLDPMAVAARLGVARAA